jgi:hypothetical protein
MTVAVILYDESSNCISASYATITSSSGFTNTAGNYVAYGGAVGAGLPGYVTIDISPAAQYAVAVSAISAGTWSLQYKAF